MNQAVLGGAMLGILFVASGTAGAFEKRTYEVVEEDRDFTLRDYGPAVVAETVVEGGFEEADIPADVRATLEALGYIEEAPDARQP